MSIGGLENVCSCPKQGINCTCLIVSQIVHILSQWFHSSMYASTSNEPPAVCVMRATSVSLAHRQAMRYMNACEQPIATAARSCPTGGSVRKQSVMSTRPKPKLAPKLSKSETCIHKRNMSAMNSEKKKLKSLMRLGMDLKQK